MRKKNHMRHHTIIHSYCRYYNRHYSRHAIVVTTLLMTAARENRMTMHAIFFPIYECPMLGSDFFLNRIYFAHRECTEMGKWIHLRA